MADTAAVSPMFIQGSGIDTAINAQQQAYANQLQQQANARANAEMALKQQLLPGEMEMNAAKAKYYAAHGDYYDSKADPTLPPALKLDTGSSDPLNTFSDDQLKGMGLSDASDSSSSDTASNSTPSDKSVDTAADASQNPSPTVTNNASVLTPRDAVALGVPETSPLMSILASPGAPNPSDLMASIANGLPINSDTINASGTRLADQESAGAGAVLDAPGSGRPSPVAQAAVSAQSSDPRAPKIDGGLFNSIGSGVPTGNNPLMNFSEGGGTKETPLTGSEIISPANKTIQSTEGTLGGFVSNYNKTIGDMNLKALQAKQNEALYGSLAAKLNPRDPNRTALVQKSLNAGVEAASLSNKASLLTTAFAQKHQLDPQTLSFLSGNVKDPAKINAIHSLVQSNEAPDYGTAAQLYAAREQAKLGMEDPQKKSALLTKMLGDLKTVTDVKNSGNVTGDNYVKLQAQENALTDQINKLSGISQQPAAYSDPIAPLQDQLSKLNNLKQQGIITVDGTKNGAKVSDQIADTQGRIEALAATTGRFFTQGTDQEAQRFGELAKAANGNGTFYIKGQGVFPLPKLVNGKVQIPPVLDPLTGKPKGEVQSLSPTEFYKQKLFGSSATNRAAISPASGSLFGGRQKYSEDNPHAKAAMAPVASEASVTSTAPHAYPAAATPEALEGVKQQLKDAQDNLEAAKGNDITKVPGTMSNIFASLGSERDRQRALANTFEEYKQKVSELTAQKQDLESRLGVKNP